jgi:hypothetical protein
MVVHANLLGGTDAVPISRKLVPMALGIEIDIVTARSRCASQRTRTGTRRAAALDVVPTRLRKGALCE